MPHTNIFLQSKKQSCHSECKSWFQYSRCFQILTWLKLTPKNNTCNISLTSVIIRKTGNDDKYVTSCLSNFCYYCLQNFVISCSNRSLLSCDFVNLSKLLISSQPTKSQIFSTSRCLSASVIFPTVTRVYVLAHVCSQHKNLKIGGFKYTVTPSVW